MGSVRLTPGHMRLWIPVLSRMRWSHRSGWLRVKSQECSRPLVFKLVNPCQGDKTFSGPSCRSSHPMYLTTYRRVFVLSLVSCLHIPNHCCSEVLKTETDRPPSECSPGVLTAWAGLQTPKRTLSLLRYGTCCPQKAIAITCYYRIKEAPSLAVADTSLKILVHDRLQGHRIQPIALRNSKHQVTLLS